MNDVASWRKILQIVGVISAIVYAVFVVLGIAVAASLIDPDFILEAMGIDGVLQGAEASMFMAIAGTVITVFYGFQLVAAIAVLRGLKNPSKMKLGIVLYAIVAVFTTINFIASIASGGDSASLAASLLVDAACMLWGSIVVYRDAK